MVAPVVILLLLGVLSYGLLFSSLNVLNNAARDGARVGSVCNTDDEVKQTVANDCASLPNAGSVSVSISETATNGVALPAGSRQRGGAITVTLTFPSSVVGIPGVLPAHRILTAQATFRMECD